MVQKVCKAVRWLWERLGDLSLAKDIGLLVASTTVGGAALTTLAIWAFTPASPFDLLIVMAVAALVIFPVAHKLAPKVQHHHHDHHHIPIAEEVTVRTTIDAEVIRRDEPSPPSMLTLFMVDSMQPDTAVAQAITSFAANDGSWKDTVYYSLIHNIGGHSRSISFYVPNTPHDYDLCLAIADHYANYLDTRIGVAFRKEGGLTEIRSDNMPFSGRLNIYYEGFFTVQQLAAISDRMKMRGAIVQLYGPAYAAAVHKNVLSGAIEPLPAYEITESGIQKVGAEPQEILEPGAYPMKPGGQVSFTVPKDSWANAPLAKKDGDVS